MSKAEPTSPKPKIDPRAAEDEDIPVLNHFYNIAENQISEEIPEPPVEEDPG